MAFGLAVLTKNTMRKPTFLHQMFVEVNVLVLSDSKFPGHAPARIVDGSVCHKARDASCERGMVGKASDSYRQRRPRFDAGPTAFFLFNRREEASYTPRLNPRWQASSAPALKKKEAYT